MVYKLGVGEERDVKETDWITCGPVEWYKMAFKQNIWVCINGFESQFVISYLAVQIICIFCCFIFLVSTSSNWLISLVPKEQAL